MDVKNKLQQLQKILKEKKLDGFLFSTTDEYINEYVPNEFKRLEYLTNFSGSFGLCIVLQDKACLFVDGRYTIQAKNEIDASLFEVQLYSLLNIENFLKNNLLPKHIVAINSKVIKIEEFNVYSNIINKLNMQTQVLQEHLVDLIKAPQILSSNNTIYEYEIQYAGLSREHKINIVKDQLKKLKINYYLVTQLDNIAWLLNLRGCDVKCNPLFLSKLLVIDNKKPCLFVNIKKIDLDLIRVLEKDIDIYEEEKLEEYLLSLHKDLLIGITNITPYYYLHILTNQSYKVHIIDDVISNLKANKNSIELQNTKKAHLRDGVYFVKLLKYVKENYQQLYELDVVEKLKYYRMQDAQYKDDSFPSIVGCGSNGAIIHYRPSEKTNKKIARDDILLIDSGAQYLDGTTDSTRTISFNNTPANFKEKYTAVLKGHINLASMIFKEGTKCCELDLLARQFLWKMGLDYPHGTGHGVGVFLCVHEIGARISSYSNVVLTEGMIFSNEPGFYLENQYGIRLENLYVVVKSKYENFLQLQCLTFIPFELSNILIDALSNEEKKWLNDYHTQTYNNLLSTQILSQDELFWLKQYMNL